MRRFMFTTSGPVLEREMIIIEARDEVGAHELAHEAGLAHPCQVAEVPGNVAILPSHIGRLMSGAEAQQLAAGFAAEIYAGPARHAPAGEAPSKRTWFITAYPEGERRPPRYVFVQATSPRAAIDDLASAGVDIEGTVEFLPVLPRHEALLGGLLKPHLNRLLTYEEFVSIDAAVLAAVAQAKPAQTGAVQ